MDEPERKRRARGDGGVHWDRKRQRFIAEKTVGYDGRGKRIVRYGSGTSETAALNGLRERVRQYEAGLVSGSEHVTISLAVEQWIELARSEVGERTARGNADNYRLHIKPYLGGRRIKDLRPDEVERWLIKIAPNLSTSTLKQVRSVLKRSIDRAMKYGMAERNVVDLTKAPKGGKAGRQSHSLTLSQAGDVLAMTESHSMHGYIVVSILTGLRPEEVRALTWDHVDLETADGVPPHIEVWRSVRKGGDTKTPKSRRTLGISELVVKVLRAQQTAIGKARTTAGPRWSENDLVFPSTLGTVQDRHNVLRMFRDALALVPGLNPRDWSPRDLRHSFVSILSQHGLPLEEVSRLMGHSGTAVTELVYRHELRPVLQSGANVMDIVFKDLATMKETPADEVPAALADLHEQAASNEA